MNIASYIDHTLLKPTATARDIEQLCKEAVRFGFAAVCVPPYYIKQARAFLSNTPVLSGAPVPVKTATVIGFPFGYADISAKVQEISRAIGEDADELDMVICIAALKNGDWSYLEREIAAVMPLISENDRQIKVIIESGVLSEEEIIRCCALYARYQVQFLKTSTGYAERGATTGAVRLMREHLPPDIRIKASGGIRTFEFADELIRAGATRLGCSAGVQIVEQASKTHA